jgi:hypothetical protein
MCLYNENSKKQDVTPRCVYLTTAVVEKQWVLHILGVFLALVIQHAKRMRCIILSSEACLAVPDFST